MTLERFKALKEGDKINEKSTFRTVEIEKFGNGELGISNGKGFYLPLSELDYTEYSVVLESYSFKVKVKV